MGILADSEFAALMAPLGPWPALRRVGVAVSGGADSLCLAYLASRWGAPVGLIVDHGLRPESAQEAAAAAKTLAALGIAARISTARGLEAGSGLAARARAVRYGLLEAACAAEGLSDLLVGHHAGDQAETVLMRGEANSGPAGLAAMPAIAHRGAVRIVRPLLGISARRLRETLRQAGIAWAEDPSNRNHAALRTRLRARLEETHGEAAGLLRTARAAAVARAMAEARRAQTMARKICFFPEGYARLAPGPIAPDCLAAAIRMMGGLAYPPSLPAVARLAPGEAVGTLGGVRILPAGWMGPGRLLVREPASMEKPAAALDGAIWDNRYRLEVAGAVPPGATLGALGKDATSFRNRSHLPFAVLQTLPVLRLGSQICAIPHLDYFTGWTNNTVKLTLSPPEPACGGVWVGGAEAARCHHVLL